MITKLPAWTPPGTERIIGLDVSGHQPVIDWEKVAAEGIQWVYVKATEGQTYKNPRYAEQMHGAEEAGLKVGWYHFFRPKGDPAAEARWALEQAGWVPSWLTPVLDVEVTDGLSGPSILSGMQGWLDIVEDRIGAPPVIYCSPGFWKSLGDSRMFHRYGLWVAHYGVTKPTIPGKWPKIAGWQYTSAGIVDGIPGRVDLNVWYEPEATEA